MNTSEPLFFSIVVPAHNEELYIEATLKKLQQLDYPKELFEVIVVENGSSDATFEKAKQFESDTFRVFSCPEKGVSRARNFGTSKITPHAEDVHWTFFLDADILLDSSFLKDVSTYITAPGHENFVAGTASLEPFPATRSMRMMYAVSNFMFSITGATFAGALFVKRKYLSKVFFDEQLQVGEDESIAKELRREGEIFFFWSRHAHSSTRRFQNGGVRKIPIWVGMWLFAMIAPYHARITTSLQRRFKYKVAR